MRVSIMGSSGSGKTRLATRLAERIECPHADAEKWLEALPMAGPGALPGH